MKIVPIGDKVVVKRLEREGKTSGGIVLPDAAKDKPSEGRVLSVGQGRLLVTGERAAPQVAEGDRVLFSTWSGTEIKIDGTELLIMSEDEILAIVG
ncbi:MAG TPA: co-chaperone GroES [Planctomycetaceae bacterium]|nr:co-chaperone GroES [Planctomycetaceae bacterium]HRF01850.1 co-chaperone GroES [Pirellulaceae bacterium]